MRTAHEVSILYLYLVDFKDYFGCSQKFWRYLSYITNVPFPLITYGDIRRLLQKHPTYVLSLLYLVGFKKHFGCSQKFWRYLFFHNPGVPKSVLPTDIFSCKKFSLACYCPKIFWYILKTFGDTNKCSFYLFSMLISLID